MCDADMTIEAGLFLRALSLMQKLRITMFTFLTMDTSCPVDVIGHRGGTSSSNFCLMVHGMCLVAQRNLIWHLRSDDALLTQRVCPFSPMERTTQTYLQYTGTLFK